MKTPHIFKGRWITHEDFAHYEPKNVFHRQLDKIEIKSEAKKNSHILFRKKFFAKAEAAKIFISADDYYKLYINGKFVCQGPAPAYPFHYYYNEVEIGEYLQEGENTLALHTYYQGLINRVWVSGDDRHGAILDIEQGGEIILSSDESFLCAYHTGFDECGMAGYSTQYMEKYNSAAREVGFEASDFEDGYWQKAKFREHLDYSLFPQPTKMLDFEDIEPEKIEISNGEMFIDFGKIYVGYLELTAKGAAADEITLLFGHELTPEGEVRHKLRANCEYVEKWLLSGGEDTLNEFDYKPVRYVKLLLPEGVTVTRVKFVARHYPFECVAKPNTDDAVLLEIFDLCCGSLEYGCQEVIQDCMEREKGNYLGDGCYTALAHAVLTRDETMMKKLIDDSLRSSFVDRGLLVCATCSMIQEIAEFPLMIYYALYSYAKFSNDLDYLREIYPAIKDVLDYYEESYAQPCGLLSNLDKWCVVEWPPNYRDGYDVDITEGKVCETMHVAINAHYIGAIDYMNKICALIGIPEYKDTKPLKEAFIKTFYDEERGLFKDSAVSGHISVIGNLFPFMYELYPDKKTAENIIALVDERGYDSMMLFGAYPFLEGLRILGKRDKIFDYIKSGKTWGRLLREGATRTFEGWGKDSKWNTSLFHLTLSYAALFLTDWDR